MQLKTKINLEKKNGGFLPTGIITEVLNNKSDTYDDDYDDDDLKISIKNTPIGNLITETKQQINDFKRAERKKKKIKL